MLIRILYYHSAHITPFCPQRCHENFCHFFKSSTYYNSFVCQLMTMSTRGNEANLAGLALPALRALVEVIRLVIHSKIFQVIHFKPTNYNISWPRSSNIAPPSRILLLSFLKSLECSLVYLAQGSKYLQFPFLTWSSVYLYQTSLRR